MGYPTANLEVPAAKLVPGDGVYAAVACWDGNCEQAAVSVGTAPTFDHQERLIEVHILDGSPQLVGARLTVHFAARLRDQRRFADRAALVAQISIDVAAAREALRANPLSPQ